MQGYATVVFKTRQVYFFIFFNYLRIIYRVMMQRWLGVGRIWEGGLFALRCPRPPGRGGLGRTALVSLLIHFILFHFFYLVGEGRKSNKVDQVFLLLLLLLLFFKILLSSVN
jgi:hypothetical protein